MLTARERVERALARRILRLPRPVVARLAGAPIARDGATLDPQVQLALVLARATGKGLTRAASLTAARRELEVSSVTLAPDPPALDRVESIRLDGPRGPIGARVYRPIGAPRRASGVVFFHGGGMVLGSLDSHDAPCRVLAAQTGAVVVSVDYRLAPEHRFPEPLEDALAAFRGVAARAESLGLDASRLAVAGDSAGGTLSAVIALETREDAIRPRFQALIYPAVDLTMSHPSIDTLGEGFFLEKASIAWFLHQYLPPGQDRRDPRVSPLYAPSLEGAPPALVLTAGFDPLRDEGASYARALEAAGVRVAHRCHASLFHGFFNASGGIDAAREAMDGLARALRDGLS